MIGDLFWREDKTGLGNTRPAEAKSTWWGIGGLTEIPPTFLVPSILKILEFSVRLSKQETGRFFSGEYVQPERRDPKILTLEFSVEMYGDLAYMPLCT